MSKNSSASSLCLPIRRLEDRYKIIDQGSMAALLVEDWTCAVRLAIASCLDDPENRDLILVGHQAQQQTVLFAKKHCSTHDFSRITTRAFLGHNCLLREFSFSLPYVLETRRSAIIVCDAAEVPLGSSKDLLGQFLSLETQLRESRHSLLWIFYCAHQEEFLLQINTCRSAFSGFAECKPNNDKIVWKTFFWNCLNQHGGEFIGQLLNATDNLGFECHLQNQGDVVSIKDADLVWSASPKITIQTCKIADLRSVTSNEELFRIGLDASCAMLLFDLAQSNDIVKVGRYIHELRVRRGQRLRMAVVESSHPLRSSSMAFLLSCGANIVFDHNATVDYIRLMITFLKGVVYPHAPVVDFEQILKSIIVEHQTGLISIDKFLSFVEADVTHHLDRLDTHGAFVMLKPASGLSHKECMEHFHPRRSGDFGTYTPQISLVYLPGCLPGFVELALSRCFELAPADLFSSYRAVYDDMEILALLKQIKSQSLRSELDSDKSFDTAPEQQKIGNQEPHHQLLKPNDVRPRPLKHF